MPKIYQLNLTDEQKQELYYVVKRDIKPYARERAAAILKVADGNSIRQVAYKQLLTRRSPDTVKRWCDRYQRLGIDGLYIEQGRGRKPHFFPSQ